MQIGVGYIHFTALVTPINVVVAVRVTIIVAIGEVVVATIASDRVHPGPDIDERQDVVVAENGAKCFDQTCRRAAFAKHDPTQVTCIDVDRTAELGQRCSPANKNRA